MSGTKIPKINSELQKQISYIIFNLVKDPRITGLVSVSKVDTTRDLKYAKVYLSIINDDIDVVLKVLDKASGYIRNELKSLMNIRNIPELKFIHDSSYEYGQKIDKLIMELKKNE